MEKIFNYKREAYLQNMNSQCLNAQFVFIITREICIETNLTCGLIAPVFQVTVLNELSFLLISFYCSIVALQCCISFYRIAK